MNKALRSAMLVTMIVGAAFAQQRTPMPPSPAERIPAIIAEHPAHENASQRTAPQGDPAAATRRYLEELQHNLTKKLLFASRRPNDEKLWANVRQTLSNALRIEWRGGRLKGTKPQEAYYVRCDRSTMTQNDLDNGRLIVLVGVAPVRPAEFQILRIAQRTLGGKDRLARRGHDNDSSVAPVSSGE